MNLSARLSKEQLRLILWGLVIVIAGIAIVLLERAGLFIVILQAVSILRDLLSIDQVFFWVIGLVICFLIALSVIPRRSYRRSQKNQALDYVPKHPVETWIEVLDDSQKMFSDTSVLEKKLADLQYMAQESLAIKQTQSDNKVEILDEIGNNKRTELFDSIEELIEEMEAALEIKNDG